MQKEIKTSVNTNKKRRELKNNDIQKSLLQEQSIL